MLLDEDDDDLEDDEDRYGEDQDNLMDEEEIRNQEVEGLKASGGNFFVKDEATGKLKFGFNRMKTITAEDFEGYDLEDDIS